MGRLRTLGVGIAVFASTIDCARIASADEPTDATATESAPADAPPGRLVAPPDTLSLFYRELLRPSRRRAETHLQLALEQLDSLSVGPGLRIQAVNESVITRLRLAHLHAPDDPEILFRLALALSNGTPSVARRGADRRVDEAIAMFDRLRELDPRYEPFLVGNELALLYTRRGDFTAAMAEYERAIPLSLGEIGLGTVLANYAEVSMEAGDLVGAIDRYERALEYESRLGQSGAGLALVAFGLAVALDRLGESEPAIERAHQAVMAGGGTLDVLSSDHVFFEPPEEVRYYQMLGELAIARYASTPNERIAHLTQALANVTRFLDEGGGDGLYADVALARRRSIEAELEQRRAARSPNPTPAAQRSARPRR